MVPIYMVCPYLSLDPSLHLSSSYFASMSLTVGEVRDQRGEIGDEL